MINPFKAIAGCRQMMTIRKFSPEILTGIGIVAGIATTVLACKATSDVKGILDDHDAEVMDIEQSASVELIDAKEAKKDIMDVKVNTFKRIVKVYAPAAGFGVLSVTSILAAQGILSKRNAALAAAYSFAQGKFNEYRDRVKKELGEDADKKFFHGIHKEKIEVTVDKDGNELKKPKTITVTDYDSNSPYAKFFDDASRQWSTDPHANLAFLVATQNWFNDRLKEKGSVFLNEVYDRLDIPRTSAGAVCGWVYDQESDDGDNYIDFGIYDIANQDARDFVNGYNDAILLDFNVDGVIWDLI